MRGGTPPVMSNGAIGDLGRAPVNRLDVKLLHPADGHAIRRGRHTAKYEGAVLLDRGVIVAAARRVQRQLQLRQAGP